MKNKLVESITEQSERGWDWVYINLSESILAFEERAEAQGLSISITGKNIIPYIYDAEYNHSQLIAWFYDSHKRTLRYKNWGKNSKMTNSEIWNMIITYRINMLTRDC